MGYHLQWTRGFGQWSAANERQMVSGGSRAATCVAKAVMAPRLVTDVFDTLQLAGSLSWMWIACSRATQLQMGRLWCGNFTFEGLLCHASTMPPTKKVQTWTTTSEAYQRPSHFDQTRVLSKL